MICFDTNIVIYIAHGRLTDSLVGDESISYPSVLKIEALGYRNIRSVEEQRLRELLATLQELPLTDAVIEHSIRLRQQARMSLGDAIVAASALEHDCTLWTANHKDFVHVEGLRVHNPLKP